MMRACGSGCGIITPSIYLDQNLEIDFGIVGLNLYQGLDQLCRNAEYEVMNSLSLDPSLVDSILDPIYKKGNVSSRDSKDSLVCTTDYMIPNYISSSIMDNFHYFNTFDKKVEEEEQPTNSKHLRKEEQFFNNHASHSDSGLMTAVVVTDEPGLEVFDQKEKCWIALERLIHEYVAKELPGTSHRKYATIFWGDSHVYLKGANLHESMHRVASGKGERYSVVFKQRTSPTATAPRYQEDYELALVQLKAMDALKEAK